MRQNSRETRKNIAIETLDIIKQGSYINPNGEQISIKESLNSAISNSILYNPEKIESEIQQLINSNKDKIPKIEITAESTIEAIIRLVLHEKITETVALNFASARHPGGGFENGSQAQEESLARSSGLYPCIAQMTEMYNFNINLKTCLYSDYMTYSPKVPFFRNDSGNLFNQPINVSIITSPAVNAGVVREKERDKTNKIHEVMINRIRKILTVAAMNNQRAVILGAFGCGVFKNNPEDVAEYFRKVLVDEGYAKLFDRIVFAIYDNSIDGGILRIFKRVI